MKKTFRCPICGKGQMQLEVVPKYNTKVNGISVAIENAQIWKCSQCKDTSVDAKEFKRWEEIALNNDVPKHVKKAVGSRKKKFGIEIWVEFLKRWSSCGWYETEKQRDQAIIDLEKHTCNVLKDALKDKDRYRKVNR